MILMAMRYNNCFNLMTPSSDECCIRYNLLNSKLIIADMHINHIYIYINSNKFEMFMQREADHAKEFARDEGKTVGLI